MSSHYLNNPTIDYKHVFLRYLVLYINAHLRPVSALLGLIQLHTVIVGPGTPPHAVFAPLRPVPRRPSGRLPDEGEEVRHFVESGKCHETPTHHGDEKQDPQPGRPRSTIGGYCFVFFLIAGMVLGR